MGCSLAASLVAAKKSLKRQVDPDFLFIEPSEMVVTAELKQVAAMGRRDIFYDIGPFITLVNGPDFDCLWQERSFLMTGQIQGADLVAISRSDLMNDTEVVRVRQRLVEYASEVIRVSVIGHVGLDRILAMVAGDG